MRNFTTAVSATVTAIVIGLLIANVASAARAAEIVHTRDQQLAALQDSYNASDTATQLDAYRTRYAQAYEQLSAAYQALVARDALYRGVVDRTNANSAQLAAANAALEARLNDAYQALRDAQALVASLRYAPTAATQAPPGASYPTAAPDAPSSAAPRATSAPGPRPTSTPRPSRKDD